MVYCISSYESTQHLLSIHEITNKRYKKYQEGTKTLLEGMLHADHNNNKIMYATCVCDSKYLSNKKDREYNVVSWLFGCGFFCRFHG